MSVLRTFPHRPECPGLDLCDAAVRAEDPLQVRQARLAEHVVPQDPDVVAPQIDDLQVCQSHCVRARKHPVSFNSFKVNQDLTHP